MKNVFHIGLILMLLMVPLIVLGLWRHPRSNRPAESQQPTPAFLERPSTPQISRHAPRHTHQQVSDTVRNSPFYRTIIDNNLFRPLGWTPPRPVEPYRLLGTLLPRDDTTTPQAILQTTKGNTTHIVSIGDKLDGDTEIVDIQRKQVTVRTKGDTRTLTLKSRF